MEKEDRIALLPFDGGWSDVGSWDSLSSLITSTAPDQDTGSVLVNSRNVFVYGSGRTIAGVGLEDLIIVDDNDATLIVKKGHSEQVKQVTTHWRLPATLPALNTASNIGLGGCSNLLESAAAR